LKSIYTLFIYYKLGCIKLNECSQLATSILKKNVAQACAHSLHKEHKETEGLFSDTTPHLDWLISLQRGVLAT